MLAALAALLPATTAAQTYSFTPSGVTETGVTLTLSGHAGWWHYKRIVPSGGACTAVTNGYVAQPSGLEPGEEYTYNAYNGWSCADENKLADTTFTTLDFRLTAKGRNTATLALDHYATGQEWW